MGLYWGGQVEGGSRLQRITDSIPDLFNEGTTANIF